MSLGSGPCGSSELLCWFLGAILFGQWKPMTKPKNQTNQPTSWPAPAWTSPIEAGAVGRGVVTEDHPQNLLITQSFPSSNPHTKHPSQLFVPAWKHETFEPCFKPAIQADNSKKTSCMTEEMLWLRVVRESCKFWGAYRLLFIAFFVAENQRVRNLPKNAWIFL